MAHKPPAKKAKLELRHKERFALVACGANFAGQLWLSDHDRKRFPVFLEGSLGELPGMIYQSLETPTIIMTAAASLQVLYSDQCTLLVPRSKEVEKDGSLIIRGYAHYIRRSSNLTLPPEGVPRERLIDLPTEYESRDIQKAFGNRYSLAGLLMKDGTILNFDVHLWSFSKLDCEELRGVRDIEYNLIGELCVLLESGSTINIYRSVPSMKANLYRGSLASFTRDDIPQIQYSFTLPCNEHRQTRFTSIHACASTFAALTNDGTIYTYGDMRHNSLGRKPGASSPPWDVVTALEGIIITKVSCNPGGWLQAALAEDGSVYLWGGYGTEKIEGLPDRTAMDEVGLVTLADNIEAENVAVGVRHVCIVEKGKKGLWLAGSSDSGELGFGFETRKAIVNDDLMSTRQEVCGSWRRWKDNVLGFENADQGSILQVASGVCNTLVVTDKGT